MLNIKSVQLGFNLARPITNENKAIIPKNNTLLRELSDLSTPAIHPNLSSYELIPELVFSKAQGGEEEDMSGKTYVPSNHDMVMDNYITDLAENFSHQIDFARNVVKPKVAEFSANIQDAISSKLQNCEAEDIFHVAYIKPHKIFYSEVMDDVNAVKSAVRSADAVAIRPASVAELREKGLFEYVKTGIEDVDSIILDFLNYMGPNALDIVLSDRKNYGNCVTIMEEAMLKFLFYRALAEKLDLQTGLGTVPLRTAASNLRDAAANTIKTHMDQYQTIIKNGQLLAHDSEVNFTLHGGDKHFNLYVYEESFNKLAEEGLTIETLFGYVVSEYNTKATVKLLIENKDKYAEAWQRVKSLYLLQVKRNIIEFFKLNARIQFDNTRNVVITETIDKSEDLNINKDKYIEETSIAFEKYLKEVTQNDLKDIDKVSLDIVAGILYSFSSAYDLLKEMKDILDNDSSIEVNDAALYSAIKYLTRFMMSQVQIENI